MSEKQISADFSFESKFIDILGSKMFVVGATARAAAEVLGVHRNTAAGFFMPLRKLIASKLPSYELSGEVEAEQ
jgi:hypothetical protein